VALVANKLAVDTTMDGDTWICTSLVIHVGFYRMVAVRGLQSLGRLLHRTQGRGKAVSLADERHAHVHYSIQETASTAMSKEIDFLDLTHPLIAAPS